MATGQNAEIARLRRITSDTRYSVELVHDGEEVSVQTNGQPQAKILADTVRTGAVTLWIHSNMRIEVDQIEIQGTITDGSLTRQKHAWVAAELKKLGFE